LGPSTTTAQSLSQFQRFPIAEEENVSTDCFKRLTAGIYPDPTHEAVD